MSINTKRLKEELTHKHLKEMYGDRMTLDEFEARFNQFSAETVELIKKQERERIYNQSLDETVKEIEKYMKEKIKDYELLH